MRGRLDYGALGWLVDRLINLTILFDIILKMIIKE